jgi:hypothetical protein
MTREELEAEAERMLVPSLRSALKSMTQRQLDNEDLARAYDMGRDLERAAVVAWLRAEALGQRVADCANHIERGEHRREEEP